MGFAFLVLFGLLTAGFTASADKTKLLHFSFTAPDAKVWKNEFFDPRKAVYVSRRGKVYYQITLLDNYIRDSSMKRLSPESIANHFRNQEKNNMIRMGVNTGMYALHDLKMGEDTQGENLYYTMTYVTKQKSFYSSAKLYLFFPDKDKVQDFLVAHYGESAPSKELLTQSQEDDFYRLLQTVERTD